jgi:hypothetical protein
LCCKTQTANTKLLNAKSLVCYTRTANIYQTSGMCQCGHEVPTRHTTTLRCCCSSVGARATDRTNDTSLGVCLFEPVYDRCLVHSAYVIDYSLRVLSLSLVEGKSGYGVTVDFAVSAARLNYCHLECNAYI